MKKVLKVYLKSLPEINAQEVAKVMGKDAIKNKDIVFPFSKSTRKQLRSLKDKKLSKLHLEGFQQFYTAYDIFQPDVNIEITEFDEENQSALYRFTNSIFLEDNDDYVYHIFFMVGITEGIIEEALERGVQVSIEKIHVAKDKKNSFFEIKIEIEPI